MNRGKPLILCMDSFIYYWFSVINKPENMAFKQSRFTYMSLHAVSNYTIKLWVQITE